MKKVIAFLMTAAMALTLLVGCGASTPAPAAPAAEPAPASEPAPAPETAPEAEPAKLAFPERDIKAMIGYGAGGNTDLLMRALFIPAEKILGHSIVVENTAGASGSTSWLSACESAPDGYTLCIGAETPALYDAYDLIDYTYNDVIPIMVVGESIQTITVAADSPYQTATEMFDAEVANPGTVIKVASGKVGINGTLSAIWKATKGFDPGTYTSEGSASSIMTVLGGFADFCVSATSAVASYKDTGEVRVLCTISGERVWDDVPTIIEEFPEMAEYLPLGAIYAICVPAGTDEAVVAYLTDVFEQAYASDEFQQSLADMGVSGLGLTGDDAKVFLDDWRLKALTALADAGAIEHTLAELGY